MSTVDANMTRLMELSRLFRNSATLHKLLRFALTFTLYDASFRIAVKPQMSEELPPQRVPSPLIRILLLKRCFSAFPWPNSLINGLTRSIETVSGIESLNRKRRRNETARFFRCFCQTIEPPLGPTVYFVRRRDRPGLLVRIRTFSRVVAAHRTETS